MNFGEYMFFLLTAPLKKHKSTNQIRIFLKVMGSLFDDTKQDIFRIRRECGIVTASRPMLQVHGEDRDMVRLKGEEIEYFRWRLLMKAIVAEKAGTEEGILFALKALGYQNCYITPVWKDNPERWAEFYLHLDIDLDTEPRLDLKVIMEEVRKVKEASAKPNYMLHYTTSTRFCFGTRTYKKKVICSQVEVAA